jgi:hypothetical protein
MKEQELKDLEEGIDNAGGTEARRMEAQKALSRVEGDLHRLENEKENKQNEFLEKLDAWLSSQPQQKVQPYAITDDVRSGRLYEITSYICMGIESALAAWITNNNTNFVVWMSILLGVVVSVAVALLLHGSLSFLLKDPKSLRKTLLRIKSYVLKPSLTLTAISLLVLFLARASSGQLALVLEPVFTFFLYTTTIGLLLLASALLSAANVLNWTRQYKKVYDALEKEERDTTLYRDVFNLKLHDLTRALYGLQAQAAGTSTTYTPHPPSSNGGGQGQQPPAQPTGGSTTGPSAGSSLTNTIPALLLAALIPFYSACGGITKGEAPTTPTDTKVVYGEMDIFIDATKSTEDPDVRTVIRDLREQLPRLVEKWNISKLTVYHFGEKGWNPEEKALIRIPELVIEKLEPPKKSDIPAAQKEREKQYATQVAESEKNAREKHQARIQEVLSGLSDDQLLPLAKAQNADCTDVNGVLGRVSKTPGDKPHVSLIITDGAQTCGNRNIKDLDSPQGNVMLVVILVPEKLKYSRNSKGEPVRGDEQFEARKNILKSKVPWASVVPYFGLNQLEKISKGEGNP